VISRGMATKRELDEFYSIEDVYDMLEIIAVDAHNADLMRPKEDR
jgi:hypothetical protein